MNLEEFNDLLKLRKTIIKLSTIVAKGGKSETELYNMIITLYYDVDDIICKDLGVETHEQIYGISYREEKHITEL